MNFNETLTTLTYMGSDYFPHLLLLNFLKVIIFFLKEKKIMPNRKFLRIFVLENYPFFFFFLQLREL